MLTDQFRDCNPCAPANRRIYSTRPGYSAPMLGPSWLPSPGRFRHCPRSHISPTTISISIVTPNRRLSSQRPDIQHAPVHIAATDPRKTLTTPPFSSPPRLLRGRYYAEITRSGPPHVGHPPPSCRELRHNTRPGHGAALTVRRFEKSLYDLIRGLRNHKGNEKEYIQKSLKECRAEVRGQDMGSSTILVPSRF